MKKRHKKLIRRYLLAGGVKLEPWQVATLIAATKPHAAALDLGMTLTLTEIRALPETNK